MTRERCEPNIWTFFVKRTSIKDVDKKYPPINLHIMQYAPPGQEIINLSKNKPADIQVLRLGICIGAEDTYY
jgi:hypothetical protein